jgi:diguanylate cyclase (GGDEF)-like protein
VPSPVGLAGIVLLSVLGPLWTSVHAARVHAGYAVTVSTAVAWWIEGGAPDATRLAGAATLLASVLLVVEVVARCTTRALEAQAATLRERAVRRSEQQRAASEQSELASTLAHQGSHDALTGLLDRAAFGRLLDRELAGGGAVGVLVAAVAGFAAVNEVLGEELGDEALTLIGRRLVGAARGTDHVARLGGDTFAVVLPGLREDGAGHVGERVTALLREPLAVGGQVLPLHCRVGLALTDASRDGGRSLLRSAEAASRAAEPGGACGRVDDASRGASADSLRDEADLRRGMDADELFLLYQPLVSTVTGTIASAEALVRWRHPERGLVAPDDFIGLAERTGLIVPLGLRVLTLACAQLRQWAPTAPSLSVAVNVSARQLLEPDFVDEVRKILWSSGVDPSRIVLELTESLVVEDSDGAVQVLWQLRGLGVRLALDDFGTGYSSLARLGDLPLDEMKIDKSFVDRLGVTPGDSTSLVTAAVAMGHGLGLEVVSEGVETAAQAAFLKSIGCDLLQGYLLGRPLPAEQVTPMLGQVLLPTGDEIPVPRADPTPSPSFVPSLMPSLAPAPRR